MADQPLDPREIVSNAQFARRGIRPASFIGARGRPARLARVRTGDYLPAERWASLAADERHRAVIHATTARMRLPLPILGVVSAAAMLRMPILGSYPTRIDVLVDAGAAGSSTLICRHRVTNLPQPVMVEGLPVAPPARTVVDLARTRSLACGLVAGDWAIRHNLCTLTDIADAAVAVPRRSRGRRSAILTARLVDPRAESPGESLSRARMYEYGFPQPELQVPLVDEHGEFGRGDFGWPGLIGEFDGLRKYRATGDAGDVSSENIVIREKRREDRARRSGVGFARWTWQDAFHAHGLIHVLSAAGLERSTSHLWGRAIGAP